VNCSGFSFDLACHFTLPFAVISVRSGEQEVSGATRSNNPFWILLMPHLTARPATGTLVRGLSDNGTAVGDKPLRGVLITPLAVPRH
jgi:hypothetical protein